MKKLLLLLILTICLESCGTLYGGRISYCQSHRPPKGQPRRQIRGAAFIGDIVVGLFLFEIPTLVDFADGAMYKPCEYTTTKINGKDSVIQSTTPPRGTLSYLDYKNGFRSMKLGTSLPNDNTMVLIGDSINKRHSQNERFYRKTTDSLYIGDYELKDITYGYYKGQLDYIFIQTKGTSNSRGVLALMQNMFGAGFKDNEYIEEYYWGGFTVDCLYDENSITGDATIVFFDKKLKKMEEEDKKKMAEKAENGW